MPRPPDTFPSVPQSALRKTSAKTVTGMIFLKQKGAAKGRAQILHSHF
jgi:hypothetical protein